MHELEHINFILFFESSLFFVIHSKIFKKRSVFSFNISKNNQKDAIKTNKIKKKN